MKLLSHIRYHFKKLTKSDDRWLCWYYPLTVDSEKRVHVTMNSITAGGDFCYASEEGSNI